MAIFLAWRDSFHTPLMTFSHHIFLLHYSSVLQVFPQVLLYYPVYIPFFFLLSFLQISIWEKRGITSLYKWCIKHSIMQVCPHFLSCIKPLRVPPALLPGMILLSLSIFLAKIFFFHIQIDITVKQIISSDYENLTSPYIRFPFTLPVHS